MFITKTNKSPFYQLTYIIAGKRTTISTKAIKIVNAYKFMSQFKIEENVQNVAHQKSLEPINISISDFQKEYLEYIRLTKSKHYYSSVLSSFKMLSAFTGDVLLKDLDAKTLYKFITVTYQRTQRGCSLYYRTLKAAFTKAILWNYISENPFRKIKSPKVTKSFPTFISESELKSILEKTPKAYLRDLITIAFYIGMRLGEILNMKWSWIDFNQKQINLKCSVSFTTKSRKERMIPFNSKIEVLLRKRFPKIMRLNNDEYVFSKLPGIKLNENYISKQFKSAVRAAELDDKIHFHTLRHSFASLLVQRGVSLYVVKELLGHEDLATTQIYSHLQQQNLRDAVNLF